MPAPNTSPRRNLLVFQIAGLRCALPAEEVPEVVLFPALVQSPAHPSFLDGFLNLRGSAVPVMPMHYLFGLQVPEPGLYTPIIVTAAERRLLGLRVDRADEIVVLEAAALQPYLGDDSFNDCAEGQFVLNGNDVVLLSVRRLLLAKERQFLAEWQAEAQRRLEKLDEALPG